ncbi:hypothetical protein V8G54_024975 [Vigna mungo]|uniref:Uncharacterized protein n=1 Tax=Vigna mungo TaxID=3915 RepID=A0AAQ3N6W5_VIGMU
MGRSAGFSLGGTYSSHRAQQQQHAPSVSSGNVSFSSVNNQDLLHLHGSDIFPSPHSTYHSQVQVLFINGGACFIMNKLLFPTFSLVYLEMCFLKMKFLTSH